MHIVVIQNHKLDMVFFINVKQSVNWRMWNLIINFFIREIREIMVVKLTMLIDLVELNFGNLLKEYINADENFAHNF